MTQKILNIVFVSLYYKPIWPGFGTRYAELLTDEAAKNGHNVTMMTGRIPKNLNVDDVTTRPEEVSEVRYIDVEELKEKMIKLYKNPDLLEKVRLECLSNFNKYYTSNQLSRYFLFKIYKYKNTK